MTEAATFSFDLSTHRIASCLTGAFEAGSAYWARGARSKLDMTAEEAHAQGLISDEHLDAFGEFDAYIAPFTTAGTVTLTDTVEDKRETLTREKLAKGLKVLQAKYQRHFADIVGQTMDASTGDALLQCALFGDIVYG